MNHTGDLRSDTSAAQISDMRCVARNEGRTRFVLIPSNADPTDALTPARVLDLDQGQLFPELPLDRVLARGGPWETNDLPNEDAVDTLLATVTSA
jgi:hypothetical protein